MTWERGPPEWPGRLDNPNGHSGTAKTQTENKQKTEPALLRGASTIGKIRAFQYFTSTISSIEECLIKAKFCSKMEKSRWHEAWKA